MPISATQLLDYVRIFIKFGLCEFSLKSLQEKTN